MTVLAIFFVVSGVLIVALVNFIVLRECLRDRELTNGNRGQKYKPAERDDLGFLYY